MIAGNPDFLFTSLSFWWFMAVVLAGFSLLYRYRTARNRFLLLCSLFFYFETAGAAVFMLLASIFLNYGCGWLIDKSRREREPAIAKFFLIIGIILNLSLLSYFKYADFLNRLVYEWIPAWPGTDEGLFGDLPFLNTIVLPVGISFFTFQALSYLVDLYRRQVPYCRNLFDFALYLSFFPQLVAGPIVRARDFLPQLQRHYQLSTKEFSFALFMVLCGLVKKIAIADWIAQWVNPVFENATLYTGFEHWMATYGYALQIYCDFSGYTDIAIGLAACLGFTLPVNFRSPYKADSFTDFWHRWHITLSTWFRDYVYIPLGGNRHGVWRMMVALLVSMTLCGIWHGAAVNFLFWGLLHGLFLCFEKLTGLDGHPQKRWVHVLKTIVYFHLICLSWVIFRTESLEAAADWYLGLCQTTPVETIGAVIGHYKTVFAIMAVGFALHFLPAAAQEAVKTTFARAPWFIKGLVCLLIGVLLIVSHSTVPQPFIYFSF